MHCSDPFSDYWLSVTQPHCHDSSFSNHKSWITMWLNQNIAYNMTILRNINSRFKHFLLVICKLNSVLWWNMLWKIHPAILCIWKARLSKVEQVKRARCFDIFRIFPFCTFCILYTLQIFWNLYILFIHIWYFEYFVFCTCCILHILHCALFVSVWYLPDISILHRAGAGATFGCTE